MTSQSFQRILPWLLVVVWIVVQAIWSLPAEIALDWMGWRQADTQTIAENFVTGDGRILYPQINWGGAGPGYVEAEFQLYTFLIALVLRIIGVSVLPGQIISLLSFAAASLVIFFFLQRRFGFGPAIFSLAALLVSRGAVFVSTTVQPDALSFLFYTLSFVVFVQYLDTPETKLLISVGIWTTLAVLVKPTALQLGIFQFLAVWTVRRSLLKNWGLWTMWGFVLVSLGLFYWHGVNLYQQYGNTFGIGLAGDSKFPSMDALLSPHLFLRLARISLAWGLGVPGAVALLYLLVNRKLDRIAISLGLAISVFLLVAFRYTSNEGYGPHYHVVSTLLSAWLIASMGQQVMSVGRKGLSWLTVGTCVLLIGLWVRELNYRKSPELVGSNQVRAVAGAEALIPLASSQDLIVVRSGAKTRSELYGTVNNYEDPIVFYVSKLKGWVLPNDAVEASGIQEAFDSGARFYVETTPRMLPSPFNDWVSENMVLVESEEGIYNIFEISR